MMVVIDAILLDSLIAHAVREAPNECCGILIGRRRDGRACVCQAVSSPNIAESDRRRNYQIDWTTLLRTLRGVRANGTEIVGFYHSHPGGPPRPSRRDLADAWPGVSYLILTPFARGASRITSWRLDAEGCGILPESLIIETATYLSTPRPPILTDVRSG